MTSRPASSGDEVLVLGAGVIGVASAWYLARQGHRVTVIDALPEAGRGTSYANGGLITPSMSDPWNAPGLPWKLIAWLGREGSPFLIRPAALPGLVGWGVRFLASCRTAVWRRSAEATLRLAVGSLEATGGLVAETAIECDRSRLGTLKVFRDRLSIEAAERGAALLGAAGLAHRVLDTAGCVALEPALATCAARIAGGIHFPGDESGDCHKFTRALALRCRELGVTFRFDTAITGFRTSARRIEAVVTGDGPVTANRYVLALGSASAALARPLGMRLPIYPVKGYSVTLPVEGWNAAPKVPIVDYGHKIGMTRIGDRLRLAGTAEFAGADAAPNRRRADLLVERMAELFPELRDRPPIESWAGLRPMTPDGLPILGRTHYDNLFLNCGHGHLGWTLACGSAKMIAALIADRTPEIDIAAFSAGRFRGAGTAAHGA